MVDASKPCLIPAGSGGFGGAYMNYERDSIEDALLPWLAGQSPGTVLDLGCGHGGLGVRMAEEGHRVICWDLQPECVEASQAHFDDRGLSSSFDGMCGTMEDPDCWQRIGRERGLLALTLMRSLIWVPADTAVKVLVHARGKLAADGRVWFVVLGCDAPIVPESHRAVPLRQRFAPISPEAGELINMRQPVTTYSSRELAELFQEAGLTIGEMRTTGYGHHKGWAFADSGAV